MVDQRTSPRMAQSPVISRERAAVEPISEAAKLADALLGVIRVRVNEKRWGGHPERLVIKDALRCAGVPFSKRAGASSLDVIEGMLLSFRLSEDLMEYIWCPDPDDSKKVMASKAGYLLALESVS